jgi:tetratricopeptide (TPR) repeat protein
VSDYIICAFIACAFIYCWGWFRKKAASLRSKAAEDFLAEREYKKAIEIYQDIAPEMQGEPRYWYNLAVALAGAGSNEDSRGALEKLFRLAPEHEEGRKLSEALDASDE